MTATYVCRHCGEPALPADKLRADPAPDIHDRGDCLHCGLPARQHHGTTRACWDLYGAYSGDVRCNPADPNSPTCEAVEAGSDIGILWAAHHDGWVARVRVHGGEIVALDVPTILADFGGDWLEGFADMADTRRPLL